ncbi:MAG TPA: ATP-dependent DNA helicase [Acidimicrobiia bacterium]|nr:ATP-dependent DNA helicase [Acidimicrobiia bacterium]
MSETRLRPDDWPSAIAASDGRQIVVAGPGTGKTEFLVRRVAHILEAGKARPSEVIVLSFSRRAAAKLADRISSLVGGTGVPVDVTTFHSLGLRLIETATGGDRPVPLTTPEQVGLVRQVLSQENPADWPVTYRGILDTQAFATEVGDFLLRCSERLLSPDDLATMAAERADWRGLPAFFDRYLAHLDAVGRTDYGVLLAHAVDLLRSERGEEIAADYRYVVVDEYQDTTPAQAAMAELLSRSHGNLTVAGDPYQSIFSFRGAEVRNIAEFTATADTRRIVLGMSFRVPEPIMTAALRVVSGGDLPGSAGPVEPASHPGRTETYLFDQETAEAEWIAREVEHLIRVEGISPAEIAVVVRSKRELIAELSRSLDRRRVPHDPPDSRLVDHPAVRLFQDVVTVAVHDTRPTAPTPVDSATSDHAMRRVLLGPLVGVSVGLERELLRKRRQTTVRWHELLAGMMPDLTGLIELLSDPAWADETGAAEGFWVAWSTLDGIADLVNDPDRDEWRRAWTAFGQMIGRQAERDPSATLARFFEMVDEDDFEATPLISHRLTHGRVSLTTLHQVKGLEFEVVFIANATEGVFPDLRRSRRMLRPELLSPERTSDPEAQHLFQIQEEMRLAYTAMTRAKRRVVWTATQAGIDQGERRPSRFLLAVAGGQTSGPPAETPSEPVTIRETETALRRTLLDVAAGPAPRIAAARVLGNRHQTWWDAGGFAGAVEPGPDQGVITSDFRLSPSQADSYRRCPRRYVLERRLRLGDPASVWAQFGSLAHDVLERAESEVIGTGARHANLDRVLEILDEVWSSADFGSPDLNAAWKAKASDMFTKLYEHWPGRGEPVGVERDVEADIEGVRWIGRVDRLERSVEGLRVVDYKTSTSAPRLDDAAKSIQLGFYAKAIGDVADEPVIASEMWYPRTDAKSVTTRKLALHLLDEILDEMAAITREVRAENWDPQVSGDCKRCAFRRSCPAWVEGRGAFLP